MLHISTSHEADRAIANTHSLSPPTVIYHGVVIEHAPASHLIIIMEGGRSEAERSGVELLSPLINVRSFVRPNMCA